MTDFLFQMSFQDVKKGSQSSLNFQERSDISTLDLTSNKLKKFSNNILPYIKNLKLWDNLLTQISNNKMLLVSDIQGDYGLQNLSKIQNNYLPQLYGSALFYRYLSVTLFNGNYMPTLREVLQFNGKIQQFKNNVLGIGTVLLQAQNKTLEIVNNTIPFMSNLILNCSDKAQNYNIKIANNSFPMLDYFYSSCNINKIQFQENFLQNLQAIFFQTPTITQFNNFKSEKLQELVIISDNLKQIKNLYLPSLTFLAIDSNSITDICTNNSFTKNLSQTSLIRANSLKSIDCLKNCLKINVIRYQNGLSAPMVHFNLPSLYQMTVQFYPGIIEPYFFNNSFPKIDRVNLINIKLSNFIDAKIEFGNTLQRFYMTNSNVNSLMFDRELPDLFTITAINSSLTNLNCSTFKNVSFLALSANKLTDSIIDTLVQCNFRNISSIYLQNNLIQEKTKARAKLSSRYPRTTISL